MARTPQPKAVGLRLTRTEGICQTLRYNARGMNGLNWFRIGLMVFAPMPFAILVAIPLWRRTEPILGNLAGTAVIFGTAIVLILKESIELDQLTNDCLESGT